MVTASLISRIASYCSEANNISQGSSIAHSGLSASTTAFTMAQLWLIQGRVLKEKLLLVVNNTVPRIQAACVRVSKVYMFMGQLENR